MSNEINLLFKYFILFGFSSLVVVLLYVNTGNTIAYYAFCFAVAFIIKFIISFIIKKTKSKKF